MQATVRGSARYIWDISKSLGQGATSKVYRGRNKTTGEEVAVKVFTASAQLRPLDVQMREYNVMKKLKHENVVRLLDIEEEIGTRNRVLVMELSTLGSLYNMLDDPQNAYGLQEDEFILVLKHIASGMKYLHENGIVHRDVKPGNILCYKREDGRLIFKLIDFGAARELENEDQQFMSLYGTEEYLHPDVYGRAVMRASDIGPFDASVDLWSLGVTIFHAATGQLPFRPYGGRRNRKTMYEITRNKEPGYISGVQRSENGRIEWSKTLPDTCRLSSGLKMVLTKMLAGLLENDDRYKLTFRKFFVEVESLVSKVTVHVFSPDMWMLMRIYIDENSKLTKLQDLIAQQSEIPSYHQLLLYNGDLFNNIVDSMTPVNEYPKSVFCKQTPIFLFCKKVNDRHFPVTICPDFPKFADIMNVSTDYQMSKQCCGVMFALQKDIVKYHLKSDLVRNSVHCYLQELRHECKHLQDYHHHLGEHCDTARMWVGHYKTTVKQILKLLKLLLRSQQIPQINDYMTRMKRNVEDLIGRGDEVKGLSLSVREHLEKYQQIVDTRQLVESWNNKDGCDDDSDRCAQRMAVMLETVQRIVRHFKDHRQIQFLHRHEEDIHAFEKNQLQELCSKSQSLIDKCDKNAKTQFKLFLSFNSRAAEARDYNDSIDKELEKLAETQQEFVEHLNRVSGEINDMMRKCVEIISEVDDLNIQVKGLKDVFKHSSSHRQGLLDEMTSRLSTSQSSLSDIKRSMKNSRELLKMTDGLLKEMNDDINDDGLSLGNT